MRLLTWLRFRESRSFPERMSEASGGNRRGSGDGMYARGDRAQTREAPPVRETQPETREGQAGPDGVADRPVVLTKPGNAGGGKGPEFQGEGTTSENEEIGMSLTTPEKIRKLQRAFYVKAKEAPSYRFHQLYDKVWRDDVLRYAYQRCKANKGAAGVDGQSFDRIEEYGRERWLGELGGRATAEGLSPGRDPAGLDRESQRGPAATGHRHDTGPGGPDGGGAGDRTGLRGGSGTRAVRISTEAKRSGCGTGGA